MENFEKNSPFSLLSNESFFWKEVKFLLAVVTYFFSCNQKTTSALTKDQVSIFPNRCKGGRRWRGLVSAHNYFIFSKVYWTFWSLTTKHTGRPHTSHLLSPWVTSLLLQISWNAKRRSSISFILFFCVHNNITCETSQRRRKNDIFFLFSFFFGYIYLCIMYNVLFNPMAMRMKRGGWWWRWVWKRRLICFQSTCDLQGPSSFF